MQPTQPKKNSEDIEKGKEKKTENSTCMQPAKKAAQAAREATPDISYPN